jgi:hypothetical protein
MSEDGSIAFVPAFDDPVKSVREMPMTELPNEARTMDAPVSRRNHSFDSVLTSARVAVIG